MSAPITESHWAWKLYQAGECCEFAVFGCTPTGRRCRDHGGCCDWPSAVHWDAEMQARLVPGTAIRVGLSEDADRNCTVRAIDADPFGRLLIKLAEFDGADWALQFSRCGAIHGQMTKGSENWWFAVGDAEIVGEQVKLL